MDNTDNTDNWFRHPCLYESFDDSKDEMILKILQNKHYMYMAFHLHESFDVAEEKMFVKILWTHFTCERFLPVWIFWWLLRYAAFVNPFEHSLQV